MARELVGDVNNDGKINEIDLLLLTAHTFEMISFNEQDMLRADINGDGLIDGRDKTAISKHISGVSLLRNTIVKV